MRKAGPSDIHLIRPWSSLKTPGACRKRREPGRQRSVTIAARMENPFVNVPNSGECGRLAAFRRFPPWEGRTVVFFLVAALMYYGCVLTTQPKVEDSGEEPAAQPLVKPFIPQDSGQDAQMSSGQTQPPVQSESSLQEVKGQAQTQDQASPEGEAATAALSPELHPPDVKSEAQRALRPKREPKPFTPSPGPPPRTPEVRGQVQTSVQSGREAKASTPESLTKPLSKAPGQREWEDQKVRRAATELVRNFPAVKKIKLCYAVKDDEWWVIMYEEEGAHYELKQFVWDRDRERLDPFLVLRRISANRLQAHLAAAEPDRACEVIDPAPISREGDDSKPDF